MGFNKKDLKPPTNLKRKKLGEIDSHFSSEEEKDQPLSYHGSKQRLRKGKDLTLDEKTDLVHDAIVKLKSNDEISSTYKVKKTFILDLVHKMRVDPNYL